MNVHRQLAQDMQIWADVLGVQLHGVVIKNMYEQYNPMYGDYIYIYIWYIYIIYMIIYVIIINVDPLMHVPLCFMVSAQQRAMDSDCHDRSSLKCVHRHRGIGGISTDTFRWSTRSGPIWGPWFGGPWFNFESLDSSPTPLSGTGPSLVGGYNPRDKH